MSTTAPRPQSLIHLLALLVSMCALVAFGETTAVAAEPEWPQVGDKAVDFELNDLAGQPTKLSALVEEGPVVLVVLRGYPGYQCPLCTLQVGQLIGAAKKLREADATVVLIYPGPADNLREYAEEFIANRTLPEEFRLLIDPDYEFTNAYHLRWDAPRETAYPTTLVIDEVQTIQFAKISRTHGGRSSVKEVLEALSALKP